MARTVQAERLCEIVITDDINSTTVRTAAWLIGAAKVAGGFPLELSLRQIREGFKRDGAEVAGTGSRLETIKASLEWLEQRGYLTTKTGNAIGFGHTSCFYYLDL